MIHHILRMQNFFTKCNGSGTFQSPKHAAHARPVWDHYGDCPSSGDIALAPWGAGTRGHLWETTADRVTTFLICRWGGGGGAGTGTLSQAEEERVQDLKAHPLLLLPLGTHFLRADQELCCQGSSLWLGHFYIDVHCREEWRIAGAQPYQPGPGGLRSLSGRQAFGVHRGQRRRGWSRSPGWWNRRAA